MTSFTYPKHEKLKSKKLITTLFEVGQVVKAHPLKMIFVALEEDDSWKIGVSVSKRNFKKAVDRNRIKRLLREVYRLHQHTLKNTTLPHAVMILYQSKDMPQFDELMNKTKVLFQKFLEQNNTSV